MEKKKRKKERKKERNDMRESVLLETDPISLFLGLLIYLLLHIGMNRVTWESAVLTFVKIRGFT